jgi:hypothetical protein
LFRAVTPADIQKVISALLKKAKSGDVASVKELLHRLLGPPEAVDLLERLDAVQVRWLNFAINAMQRFNVVSDNGQPQKPNCPY